MAQSATANIIDTVDEWFAKLPNLPKNIRDLLVTITPWIALIFGGLGVVFGILALVGTSAASPFLAASGMSVGSGIVASVLLLASSALLLAAFPGTKNKRAKGWEFLFWSEVVALVSSVLVLSLGGLVVNLIGFYLIFQIRSYFK